MSARPARDMILPGPLQAAHDARTHGGPSGTIFRRRISETTGELSACLELEPGIRMLHERLQGRANRIPSLRGSWLDGRSDPPAARLTAISGWHRRNPEDSPLRPQRSAQSLMQAAPRIAPQLSWQRPRWTMLPIMNEIALRFSNTAWAT